MEDTYLLSHTKHILKELSTITYPLTDTDVELVVETYILNNDLALQSYDFITGVVKEQYLQL